MTSTVLSNAVIVAFSGSYYLQTLREAVDFTGRPPNKSNFLSTECMMGLYIPVLLAKGFTFQNESCQVHIQDEIHGKKAGTCINDTLLHAYIENTGIVRMRVNYWIVRNTKIQGIHQLRAGYQQRLVFYRMDTWCANIRGGEAASCLQ